MTALQVLRIFGPCSIGEVARRTGVEWAVAKDDLLKLHFDGLATVSNNNLWDYTPQDDPQEQRAKDAACEGVRQ